MIWIIIAALLVLLLCWLLFSPVELQVDTRIPVISVRWISIGKVALTYVGDAWWLKVQILFFRKNWEVTKLLFRETEKQKAVRKMNRKKRKGVKLLTLLRVLKTFKVREWQIAIDGFGNEWLYPLNLLPYTNRHVFINFIGENFFVVKIRNLPCRLIYAWIR